MKKANEWTSRECWKVSNGEVEKFLYTVVSGKEGLEWHQGLREEVNKELEYKLRRILILVIK